VEGRREKLEGRRTDYARQGEKATFSLRLPRSRTGLEIPPEKSGDPGWKRAPLV